MRSTSHTGTLPEEFNRALFRPFRRRPGAVVEMDCENRVRREGRARGVFRIEFDGLEAAAEFLPISLEALVGHEIVFVKSQADHREVFLLEAFSGAANFLRRSIDRALLSFPEYRL